MYGHWIFGTHDEAVRQSQIAPAQRVFTASSFIFNATHIRDGGITQRYQYGVHEATILQSQIANASVVFRSFVGFPQKPILGLKRDFVITQEEQPLDSPSFSLLRGVYLASAGKQNPLGRPAIQNFPEWPQDRELLGNVVFSPQPKGIPPSTAKPAFQVIQTVQEDWPYFQNLLASNVFQPIGQTGGTSVSLQPPTILGLEDPGVDTTTLLGTAQLRWSAVPGASAYRVYINGVPQNPPIFGQSYLATGLVVANQYKFGVVAVAAGIDDSPMSNEIYYEHGTNEFTVVYKYPWGNTFKTGYILKIKLGTPE